MIRHRVRLTIGCPWCSIRARRRVVDGEVTYLKCRQCGKHFSYTPLMVGGFTSRVFDTADPADWWEGFTHG